METRVLIPSDLILRVSPSKDCSSPLVARFLEVGVSVVSKTTLPQGTILPLGSVRVGRLEVYSSLSHTDSRHGHVCIDEVAEGITGHRIRKCNWVRFASVHPKAYNVRSLKPGVFEITECIYPHTELILNEAPPCLHHSESEIEAIQRILNESALDLSTPLLEFEIPSDDIIEDRKSVISDSGISSSEENETNTSPLAPSHPLPKKANSKKKMLPCDYCGKCFDRPSLLNRHLRTHTGERPHVCDVCDKGFSTSSSLNTHRRIHSGEKPHECETCGKRFTASSNLYYHRMTHVKEKPHKCELCQKSFPTPGDLKSHMYIHNGSWPHRCHICDRGFSKVTNLKNHLFLHTGEKPHECPVCGKRFALGCNMKAHLKTHHTNNTSPSK